MSPTVPGCGRQGPDAICGCCNACELCANPDVPAYWAAVRERWPTVSLETCWRLAYCGTVCRTLAAMSWIADNLANDGAHACLGDMRLYAAELEGALRELDWAGRV